MDLTQSLGETRVPVLVTNVEYDVEEVGHRVDTPVLHVRSRQADGTLVETEVEGFRPYFAIRQSDFAGDSLEVCNDRRVIGAEVDCSPDIWADVVGFDPDEVSAADVEAHLSETLSADIYHTPDPYTTIHDEPVARVYTRVPGDVGGETGLRGALDCDTFEADVPFVRRFLITAEIYQAMAVNPDADRVRYENWPGESDGRDLVQELEPVDDPPAINARMVVYDIEVATEGEGFPEPDRALHPITSISAYDSYTDEYRLWGLIDDGWDTDPDQLKEDVRADVRDRDGFPDDTDGGPSFANFELFADETQLLESFHRWVLECDPDIFTGYSADGFDTPYLIQRSYNIQALSIKRYSETGNPGVWVEEYNGERQVNFALPDRSTLDILEAYKKTQFRELDSYQLDDVADAELGFGKVGLDGDELDAAWHNSPVEFYAYSLRDAQATAEVEAQAGLMELFENLRSVTGAPYETAVSNGPMLDTLFLRRAHEKRLVLPSNTEPDETVFHGARVFDPVPGVHRNCVYPDLACFTPDHEVVTPDGIVNIRDLDVGDKVYSIDPDTQEVELKPVVDVHEYDDYTGEIETISTPQTDLSVTPNHNLLLDEDYGDEFEFIQAGDLDPTTRYIFPKAEARDDGDGIDEVDITEFLDPSDYDVLTRYDCHGHHFRSQLPDGCEKKRSNYHHGFFFDGGTFKDHQDDLESLATSCELAHPDGTGSTFRPYTFDGDAFIEFLGWFITEGSLYNPGGEQTTTVQIAQEIEENRERIEQVFDDLGLDPSVGDRAYALGSGIYGTLLEDLCGNGSYNKRIPEFIFERASTEQKQLLFDTLMAGDGSKNVYYTASTELRDDFSRLCTELGYEFWYQERKGAWEIHTGKRRSAFNGGSDVTTETADDGVYCVTVEDNHTLLAGRNGKFNWVGQSMYPNLFAMLNLGSETIIGTADELASSPYDEDDCLEFPVDERDFAIVPKGEPIDHVDRDEYKGVKTPQGGVREMFDPVYDTCYVLKPDIRESFVRDTVDELIDLKYQYSGNLYSAVKRIVNSVYGVMGDSASGGLGFRLYDRRVAEGITLAGRLTITYTAEEFTEYLQDNYDPDATLVGGDTDSSTTSIPNAPDMKTAWEWANEAVEYVDASYDEFAQETFDMPPEDHRLEVELESLASALFYMEGETDESYQTGEHGMLVKDDDTHGVRKRYAQSIVWDDDDGWIDTADPDEGYEQALTDPEDRSDLKYLETVSYDTFNDGPLAGLEPTDIVSITGFEYVRSDSAQITRDAQLQVLTDILLDPDPKDRIESYLNDTVDGIENGDVPLGNLARPKGISQQLDEYGWKDVDDLSEDDITDEIEQQGGTWRQTPGPTYRGAKYADDWLSWEQLGAASKPLKVPIEKVRGDDHPQCYEYHSYPEDSKRPDPPEVGEPVDAIAVENPDRLPDSFVVDTDSIVEKAVRDPLEDIIETMGYRWDDLLGDGSQSSLDAFV